jgi:Uma2 family endonuclease
MAPSDVQFDRGNVYQPDIFFIRNERSPIVDEQGPKGAPDLVVEVISGSTGRLDLGPKKMSRHAVRVRIGVTKFSSVSAFPRPQMPPCCRQ